MNGVRPSSAVARRPPGWALRAVRLAARVLPRGTLRDRYEQEFQADLWDLTGRAAMTYSLSVLVNAFALRSAVTTPEALAAREVVMRGKPITCRLNIHHRWRWFSTEDGARYRECERCHKEFWTHNALGGWG